MTKLEIMKNDMIRMAIMAVLSVFICGCRTQHKWQKETISDEAVRNAMNVASEQMTMEDLKRIMREKENWHIVWYDNSKEPDKETGEKTIAAEAWLQKDIESEEEKVTTEIKDEERHEENELQRHEEEKKESDTSLRTGMEWWQTVAMAAGALLVLMLMMAIRKAADR